MADKEEVVRGLECCTQPSVVCETDCPYSFKEYLYKDCRDLLMADALALLKAQEAKLVHVTAKINYRKIGECPTCGKLINSGDYPNYCGACGQAVKWE